MTPAVSFAALYTLGVIMTMVIVFSLTFNGCGLLVFLKTKSLRSPANWFIMSLCVCDMFMAFAAIICTVACFNHDLLSLHGLCVFEGFVMYFLGLTSMYLLASISLLRYIMIAKPSLKPRITYRSTSMTIACCIGFGFLWSSLPLMGWNRYTREGAGVSCSVLWQSDDIADTSYIIVIFIVCLLIPAAVMGYSYFHVYMAIRNVRRQSTLGGCGMVQMRNFLLEKKMLKTCIIMVSVFLLSWLPYSITSLISASGYPHLISPLMGTIPAIIAKMNGLWNPIIYIATNKQFRDAFYKMLPCQKKKTPVNHAVSEYETIGYTSHNFSNTKPLNSVMPTVCKVNKTLAVVEQTPRTQESCAQDMYHNASFRQASSSRRSSRTSATDIKPTSPRWVNALPNTNSDK